MRSFGSSLIFGLATIMCGPACAPAWAQDWTAFKDSLAERGIIGDERGIIGDS